MSYRNASGILVAAICISILLHWKIFSLDLNGVHIWRQSQNEWYIRNFVRHDHNFLYPKISALNHGEKGSLFRSEFPLMQWSIAQVQRLFGEYIFIVRIMMFLISILSIIGLFHMILALLKDRLIAALTACSFTFAPIFYYYSINPMSDIWAMCAQIWMMVFLIKYIDSGQFKFFIRSCLLLMIAGLCKLPFFICGIMLLTASVQGYLYYGRSIPTLFKKIFFLIIISAPVAAWYFLAFMDWEYQGVFRGVSVGFNIVDFWTYFKFALFHWVPMHLVNVFALLFLLIGLKSILIRNTLTNSIRWVLLSGLIITLIYYFYEINMINKIHDYYMLPFLIWLHIGIALGLHSINLSRYRLGILFLFLAMPVYAYLKTTPYWNQEHNPYNADWFKYSGTLQSIVPADSLCIMLNDNSGVVVAYAIDKQGYVFDRDDLPPAWIEDMILHRNTYYMYSDSRVVDTSGEVRPFLDSLLMERGSIRVFKLISSKKVLDRKVNK